MPSMKLVAAIGSLLIALSTGQCVATSDPSHRECFTLYAGQNIDVGTLCAEVVGNTTKTLRLTYTTTGDWQLSETHLWIGGSVTEIPTSSKGNPIPGQFPYKNSSLSGTEFFYNVPLSTLPTIDCPTQTTSVPVLFAAHATVTAPYYNITETAWSIGNDGFNWKRWGWFSTLTLTCDCGTGGASAHKWNCETAFAKSNESTCFTEIIDFTKSNTNETAGRWGWTNGPVGYSTEPTTSPLYAGAGQCDVTKGSLSGWFKYTYSSSGLFTAGYSSEENWEIKEVHLYAGTTNLPLMKKGKGYEPTVAPGQYGNIYTDIYDTAISFEFNIANSPPAIYYIAHAVMCEWVLDE